MKYRHPRTHLWYLHFCTNYLHPCIYLWYMYLYLCTHVWHPHPCTHVWYLHPSTYLWYLLSTSLYTSVTSISLYTSVISTSLYTSVTHTSLYTSVTSISLYTSVTSTSLYTSVISTRTSLYTLWYLHQVTPYILRSCPSSDWQQDGYRYVPWRLKSSFCQVKYIYIYIIMTKHGNVSSPLI